MQSISVIIPVYRAESRLKAVVNDIVQTLTHQNIEYEILLIEDCGGDNSWETIQNLHLENPLVTGIKLNRNFGQHNALLCGIRNARKQVIVTMDDDGQHPSDQIIALVNALGDDNDVVYGAPIAENHGFFRDMASVLTKKTLKNLMGVNSASNASAFRAFHSHLRTGFDTYNGPIVNIDIMLTWATERFTSIKVKRLKRSEGSSGYTVSKLINHGLNMVTGFSGIPLRVASYCGIFFALFGFFVLLYILINYSIRGSAVPGFAFLGSIITLFSGVQLLTIGIIGEYIGRIHFNSMDKPAYVIGESCGLKQDQEC